MRLFILSAAAALTLAVPVRAAERVTAYPERADVASVADYCDGLVEEQIYLARAEHSPLFWGSRVLSEERYRVVAYNFCVAQTLDPKPVSVILRT